LSRGVEDPFDKARYLPIPALSPYVRHDRYERPKEIFKHLGRKLSRIVEPERRYEYADVATANGELLYYLRKRFPHWRFSGYDMTPEFIETGRTFPGLAGVDLQVRNLYEMEGQFDLVSFINVMTSVWDAEEPLGKLLSLVKKGGVLLVDGCFNEYDVEFRGVFMDNSRPESAGRWRRECSQHSRKSIAGFLRGRCKRFEFEEVPMGVEIPRVQRAPDSNVWTFKDEEGRIHITNGTRMLMDKTLLTVYL
jgi:SAM-dependent methyltransferase